MNKFDNFSNLKLNESIIFNKTDLDPAVFSFTPHGIPILNDGIRMQILNDIDAIKYNVEVVSFYLVGDILTEYHERSTPLEVFIQINLITIDNISIADILHTINNINGRMAIGTMHPINYYISVEDDIDITRFDAIYDVSNLRWIKTPITKELFLDNIITEFKESIKSINLTNGSINNNVNTDKIEELETKYLKRLLEYFKQQKYLIKTIVQNVCNPNNLINLPHIQKIIEYKKCPANISLKMYEYFYINKMIYYIENIINEKKGQLTNNVKLNNAMSAVWKK